MILADISVQKLARADPRYPGIDAAPTPFSDVYLMTCKTDDGQHFECPFYVLDLAGHEMTTSRAANMLRLFAAAIAEMDQRQQAA